MMKLSVGSLEAALDQLRPERFFVVLALTAGLCMVFVNAPFEAPDEAVHSLEPYGGKDRHHERSALGFFCGPQLLCGPPGCDRTEMDGELQCDSCGQEHLCRFVRIEFGTERY